jgi:hypothetical protein
MTAAAVLLLVTAASCKEDAVAPEPPILSIASDSVTAVAAGGSYTVATNSNVLWTAESSAAWCTVDPGEGIRYNALTVHVTANDVEAIRMATITLTAEGVEAKTITVKQAAKAPFLPVLDISKSTIDATTSDSTYTVTVKDKTTKDNTTTWTVTSTAAWCAVDTIWGKGKGKGIDTLKIRVPANPDDTARIATITVEADSLGGAKMVKTITVTQATKAFIWKLAGGKLTLNGECPMPNYAENSYAPWYAQRENIKSIVINDSLTNIGDFAFLNCTDLTSVTISASVTSIGTSAFGSCIGLTSITIPKSVTSIEENAFSHCTGLTSIDIPDSVTTVGTGAFAYCSGLTSVTIPKTVTSIEESTFAYSGLTSVTIPTTATSIGENAFSYCANLAAVHVSWSAPDAVTLDNNAFFGIKRDAKLHVPSGSLSAYKASELWKTYFKAENMTEK